MVVAGKEHVQVGVENGLGQQGKVLVLDSSLISPLLTNKLNPKGAFKVALDFPQLFHGVIQKVVSVDREVEVDEPLDAKVATETDAVDDGGKARLHILADVHFLLVD